MIIIRWGRGVFRASTGLSLKVSSAKWGKRTFPLFSSRHCSERGNFTIKGQLLSLLKPDPGEIHIPKM